MSKHSYKAFYDPKKTFDDNFNDGPSKVFEDEPDYQNTGEPKYSFLGHKLYSPFGIPAGPLPTSDYVKYAFDKGFDVNCYKTQRSVSFKANDFPNILYIDVEGDLTLEKAAKPLVGRETTEKDPKEISITNSFGNPSKGSDFWVPDLKKAVSYQQKGQLLIMSVVGTIQDGFSPDDYYDDFALTAELAVKAGAKVIELNLSCPNVASEGVLCYSYDAVLAVCQKTKERIGNVPLVAKFGYFSADQDQTLRKIINDTKDLLSAISVINTISAPIVDDNGEQALPGPNRLNSGVCGRSVRWAGLDMVKRLNALREEKSYEYEIIGVGGVMNADDFKAYRKAGADVVQSATGAMWNPKLAAEIKASL